MTTNTGPSGGVGVAELFTIDQLTEISQNLDPVANDLAGDMAALIPEMKKGGIVTKNQITAFLANVCQETDHLNTLEEYGDEAYYRSFLGDEWVYHGRGYIMNTWLDAYQRLSSILGVDLVSDPDLLARDKNLAAKAAVWFWTTNDIGPVADQGDFVGVCSLINRGENPPQGPIHGWEERLAAYERAQAVIGTGTEPIIEPDIEGSEPVTIQPKATVEITLGYDKDGWAYDTASGLYVKSNTADLDHKTNKDGWLWAKVETSGAAVGTAEAAAKTVQAAAETVQAAAETVEAAAETVQAAVSTWPWPEAWDDPIPGSGWYVERHPTRYTWREDVEAWARWLVDTYGVWVNTYLDHPEGYGRDYDSMDVWGSGGRGDPVGYELGQEIWGVIFNDPNPPNIDWIIWQGWMWTAGGGWEWFSDDTSDADMGHFRHIHVTYK